MIGLSVSDILKLLDQVPIWKTLATLPKRLAALEERVAALEAGPKVPPAMACPLCEAEMKVTASRAHPQFGVFGLQERTITCSGCGHAEKREFDPKKA